MRRGKKRVRFFFGGGERRRMGAHDVSNSFSPTEPCGIWDVLNFVFPAYSNHRQLNSGSAAALPVNGWADTLVGQTRVGQTRFDAF